ncbi:MAG: hypothetical protein DI628_05450 [Blastochloris viridis]|uniref:SURF1-like protein n=1 Tax=Blastochloris viridis TaxID=1079 RepID=A0A6N4RFZ2_BLAVI|nr:MAG: hypothetical protein DI628_05450 [Blastochloris viridis]
MKKHRFVRIVPLLVLAFGIEAGLLSLSNWQRNRYHQSLTEQAEFAARPSQSLSGTWQPEATFALTNQPNPRNPEAEIGWRILTPLSTPSGTIIIDRGYATPRYHADMSPDFSQLMPTDIGADLAGVWQPFPQRKGWLRGPDTTTHPRLLAFLNPQLIVSDTQPVYFLSRTASSEEITAVPPPLPAPTKHLSYALQWLGMALAFPLLCVFAYLKSRRAGRRSRPS